MRAKRMAEDDATMSSTAIIILAVAAIVLLGCCGACWRLGACRGCFRGCCHFSWIFDVCCCCCARRTLPETAEPHAPPVKEEEALIPTPIPAPAPPNTRRIPPGTWWHDCLSCRWALLCCFADSRPQPVAVAEPLPTVPATVAGTVTPTVRRAKFASGSLVGHARVAFELPLIAV